MPNVIHGSDNPDVIDYAATGHNDIIFGYGGDDQLLGLKGDDVLNGGAGADTLIGMDGSDWASYQGSPAAVTVNFATGYAYGGDATGDIFWTIENLQGSEHNDTLIGDDRINQLLGMGGNDFLDGGQNNDYLGGGDGNDLLKGGGGADMLVGGAGIDTATYADADVGVTVSLMTAAGTGGDADGDTFQNVENLTGSDYRDVLEGNSGINRLRGGDGHDNLYGLGGTDTLEGGDGNDWLDGGTGGDTMRGGDGPDIYIVDHVWDTVIEHDDQGADTVLAHVSWTLSPGAEIEYLQTGNQSGTSAINLTGNEGDNVIVGNDGNNILNGGGGLDHITGRDGNDTYIVNTWLDEVIEYAGQGSDTVLTSSDYRLAEGRDIEMLATTNPNGMTGMTLLGNSSGNVIIGNNASNDIGGGDGNDELIGRGGTDTFLFDTALDAEHNVDELPDFNVADDTIHLENTIFGAFAAGSLAAERFVVGPAPQDASDCIIYDSSTGFLYYDSDGTGAAAMVPFAELAPGVALTHLDFQII
jgi:Ca2+-binding RTX toxin-like protein